MSPRIRTAIRGWLAKFFHLAQRLGFDVLPRHFYSEIPCIFELRQSGDWRQPFSMIGVRGAALAEQLEFVRGIVTPALTERTRRGDIFPAACQKNGAEGYGQIEAEFLFAFVTTRLPRRVLQIGCGVSTAVCLHAAREAGYPVALTCIEPFPTAFLRQAAAAGEITLLPKRAQEIGATLAETLEAGDLFFVDSTHALGPAGEVTRIILEMLPRLRPGVHVHFHDIYFPYDYIGNLLTTNLFFGHESALLHGFLAYNSRFRIQAALSMLHHGQPADLAALLPNYRPRGNDHGLATTPGHFPSSAYLLAE
jgi:SAM-dependent methyltransferase